MAKKPDKEIINEEEILEGEESEAPKMEPAVEIGAEESDELASMHAELEQLRSIAEENLDGWQRSQAEFANYRKRIERDRQQQHEDVSAKILVKYLDVVDDMERALKNAPQDNDGAQWAEGISLIYRKLMTILENEGVASMGADGSMFDPNLHEAIAQEDSSEHESGQIIEVIQQGYTIGERVLRPAMVRIAK